MAEHGAYYLYASQVNNCMNALLQRLTCAAALGYCFSLVYPATTIQFWAMLVLLLLWDLAATRQGGANALDLITKLRKDDLLRLRELVRMARRGQPVDMKEIKEILARGED